MSNNPARSFIDTNIWLYAFIENDDTEKTFKAKGVIDSQEVVISTQVINELCMNLLRKADFTEEQLRELIADLYDTYLVVELDRTVQVTASTLRERYQFSFWDSTIVANALLSEAQVLYSEDMHDGLVVEGKLTIRNPVK
jgi:predicted nucleic acid-binding protein